MILARVGAGVRWVRLQPAGLGKGMLNWSGKVRLDTLLLRCNNKYCHNLYFPGTTKIQLCLNRNYSSFKNDQTAKTFHHWQTDSTNLTDLGL